MIKSNIVPNKPHKWTHIHLNLEKKNMVHTLQVFVLTIIISHNLIQGRFLTNQVWYFQNIHVKVKSVLIWFSHCPKLDWRKIEPSIMLKDISTPYFSTQSFNPRPFNPGLFKHELFNPRLYNPRLFNHELLNPRFLNPGLFNPTSGVEKSGVGKSMVEKSGVEMSSHY